MQDNVTLIATGRAIVLRECSEVGLFFVSPSHEWTSTYESR